MRIEFAEEFVLPVCEVYSCFRSPTDWPRLYGSFGEVQDRGEGWFAVPLRRFPFPLVARITSDDPLRCVRWTFRGFWRGEGEVLFLATSRGGVAIRGYESISARPLAWLPTFVERVLLERPFGRVWEAGWRRLRRQAARRGDA